MNVLKKAILNVLSALGYELNRLSGEKVSLNYFVILAQAYEQRLNESNNLILANEIRPKLLAQLLRTLPSEEYFIVQALTQSKNINGYVCEIGVPQGETSALITNEMAIYNYKILYLFDSFEGPQAFSKRSIEG